MSTQNHYETIEAYLGGTLIGADLTDFETRLQNDPSLAEQVSLFKEADAAISDKKLLNFQKMVQSEGATFAQKNKPTEAKKVILGWSRSSLAIAASVLVVLVSALIFWNIQSSTPPSGKVLFAQYFETYTLNQSIRGEEDSENAFQSAVQQYQTKDYSMAAASFQELAANNANDMVLAFCLANAYLNQGEPELALAAQQFQKIIDEGQSIYVLRAKWYLALINLKQGELKKAEKLLNEVAKSSDSYRGKAKELLEQF